MSTKSGPGDATIAFRSSMEDLDEGFCWARDLALNWVQTGRPGVTVPSYWCGLTDRAMFYSRDLAHQALAGHLLGLDTENWSMFRHFAASATSGRRFYPLWSFTFDGEPADIDYHDDQDFVRETPAPYELVERALEQYRWTGDRRWISDPVMIDFYRHVIDDFARLHDVHGTGLAGEARADDIFAGSPTYDEARSAPDLQVAGDGIASQWAALAAAADVLAGVDDELAARAGVEAARIATIFNTDWWLPRQRHFMTGLTGSGPVDAFAYEASWFPAVKGIITDRDRAERQLDYLTARLEVRPPTNIEATTYLPDAFLRYDRDAEALSWIRHLMSSGADYPEVPYTLVSHLAVGLTGVRPVRGGIRTRSHIDDAEWIESSEIQIGEHRITLRHDGRSVSRLTVSAGPGPLSWTAEFPAGSRTATVEVGQTRTLSGDPAGDRRQHSLHHPLHTEVTR